MKAPWNLPPWTQSLHSEANGFYVSNPQPGYGESVRIELRVDLSAPIDSAELRIIQDGGAEILPMKREEEGRLFVRYFIDIFAEMPTLQYQFLLRSEGRTFFYTRGGVTPFHPTEDYDFMFFTENGLPDWVPGAVFYQIFPDRFCNGNPESNVKTGDYHFDGGTPTEMEWDQAPLEYNEGRCMDFFNGDLDGIRQKIPYLKELGVTALYLNPIFSARTTHRYDCTDYFEVDPALGGDEALIRLTKALHAEGMKIILDVSINHTGREHKWFKAAQADPESEAGRYYYHDPETGDFAYWWDFPTLPQLNYNQEELQKVIWKNPDALVRKWIKPPFNCDGWRFDVGNQTARRKKDQLGHFVFREIRKAVREENPQAYIIGEHWEDNIAYLLGDQWDGAMNYFTTCRPFRRFLGERDRFLTGHDHEAGTAPPISGYELQEMIEQHYRRLPGPSAYGQFNLIDSHDLHRIHNHKAVYNEAVYRGILIMQYLMPGTPSLYYGDEILLEGHIDSIEGCRFPMQWNKEKQNRSLFGLYQLLGRLKQNEEALQTGSWKSLYSDETTYALARFSRNTAFLGILNRSEEEKSIELPVGLLGITRIEDGLESGYEEFIETAGLDAVCKIRLKPFENRLLKGTIEE